MVDGKGKGKGKNVQPQSGHYDSSLTIDFVDRDSLLCQQLEAYVSASAAGIGASDSPRLHVRVHNCDLEGFLQSSHNNDADCLVIPGNATASPMSGFDESVVQLCGHEVYDAIRHALTGLGVDELEVGHNVLIPSMCPPPLPKYILYVVSYPVQSDTPSRVVEAFLEGIWYFNANNVADGEAPITTVVCPGVATFRGNTRTVEVAHQMAETVLAATAPSARTSHDIRS